jgi:hypothetical protein
MKKYIVLIVLLLLSIHLNAQQPYKHCLDDGVVKWSIAEDAIDRGFRSREYVAFGDSLINGILYKKIYLQYSPYYPFGDDVEWMNYIPDFPFQMNEFIRESEDASKLYILDAYHNKNIEYLISDLNLQKGDEFPHPHFQGEFIYVDSVYTKDGLKHVQLDFWVPLLYEYEKLTFIEGIGPNIGILAEYHNKPAIHCFQNQTLFYKNDKWNLPCGFCYPPNSIRTILNKDYSLIIKEDKIEISFSIPANRQVSIYDISGCVHYNKGLSFRENLSIPSSSFSKGVYVLKIFNKDANQINISKIIL